MNNKTICTMGNFKTHKKTRDIVEKQNSGTSGCLYLTNVNLYLHPNVNSTVPDSTSIINEMPKVKTRCNSPNCFYYDSDLLGNYYDDYYCCNPLCTCFRPDWYCYL